MPLPTTTTSASSSDIARVLVTRAPVSRDIAVARASTARRVAARIARVDDAVAVADIRLVVVVVVVASRTASSPPSSSRGDDDVDEEKPRTLVIDVDKTHTTTRPN